MAELTAVFKARDDVSPAMMAMANSGKEMTDALKSAGEASASAFRQAEEAARESSEAFKQNEEAAKKGAEACRESAKAADDHAAAIKSQESSLEEMTKAADDYSGAASESARASGELAEQVSRGGEASLAAAEAAKQHEEAIKKGAQAADELKSANAELEAKLSQLQDAYIGVAHQYGKNSDEAKNLQKEIGELSKKVGENQKEFAELEKASGKAGNAAAGSVGEIQGALAAAGIAALVAGITSAVMDMADAFSEAQSAVAKATGATGAQLDGLSKSMMNVYAAVDDGDLKNTAAAIGEINTRLGLQGEALESVGALFMQYADNTNTAVLPAIQSVTKVMKNWNVDASETESLLDKLTYAGQASGASVNQLSDMLYNNKAMLDQLGYGLNESLALFSMFEIEGIDAAAAMAGFRSALKNFSGEGKDASTAMEEIVSQIAAMKGTADPAGLAIEIFGTKAGPKLADAIQSGRFGIEEWTKAIEDSNGTLQRTDAAADTVADKWQQASNNMKAAFSETLSPAINAASSAVAGLVGGIGDFLRQNKWLTAIITGIGTALTVVVGGLAAYKAATMAAKIVTDLFGASVKSAMGVIGLVAAGIAAVVAAAVLLYDAFGEANKEFDSLTATSKENYLQMQKANKEYEAACETYGETSGAAMELRYRVDELTAAYEANKKTHEQYRAEMDATLDRYRKTMQAYSDSMADIKQEETGALALINRLNKLQGAYTGAAGESAQMAAIVDKLNEKMPDLGLSYDKATGAINKTAEAMREFAKAEAERARNEAMSDKYMEAVAQEDELLAKLQEAKDNLAAEKEAVGNSFWGKAFKGAVDYDITTDWLASNVTKLAEYRDDISEAEAALQDLYQTIEEGEAAFDAQAKAAEEAAKAQEQAARELAEAQKNVTAAHEANAAVLEKAAKASDALIESNKSLVESYDSSANKIKAEESGVSALMSKLAELSKKTNLSASEQKQMAAITDKLNNQMPGLALSYDKATGALDRSIDSMKAMASAEADRMRNIELQKTYAEALASEAALQEQINENAAKAQAMRAEYYSQMNESPDLDYSSLLSDIDAVNDKTKELRDELNKTRGVLGDIESAWEDQASAAVGYAEAVAAAVSGASEDLQKLAEDYDKAFDAAKQGIDSTVGLFNEMATESKASVDDMMKAMESQLEFIAKYEYNVKEAARYGITDGLLESLSDGKQDSAEYIDAIVQEYQRLYQEAPEKAAEFVASFNQQFEGVETAKDSFAATVAEMQTGFSSGMDEIEARLVEAIDSMNMEADAAEAAKETISAYVEQIKSMTSEAHDAAASVAQAAASALSANNFSIVGVPGYATGATNAPDMFIAGEKGPELIVGAGGSTVFPAEETAMILSSAGKVPLSVSEPEGFGHGGGEGATAVREEKKITLEINGSGELDVGGADEEAVWGIVAPKLKDAFMAIVRAEIFEEGDRSYAF